MKLRIDNTGKGRPVLVLCLVGMAFLTTQCAPLLRGGLTCDGIEIISNELTVVDAEVFCRYAMGERKKVAEFWGAAWTGLIRINVSSSYRITRALVPGHFGNRGFMEMPLRHLRDNTTPLLHEIVHIYAPNDNRFLAEGLAVYLHAKLAGNPAFPNFGEGVDRAATRSLAKTPSMQVLNRVRTPQPLSTVMDEQAAYTIGGSFVGFLIERYSLDLFRKLYETDNYNAAYAKSLDILEQEWRQSIVRK